MSLWHILHRVTLTRQAQGHIISKVHDSDKDKGDSCGRQFSAFPQIAKDADGRPLFTTELFVLVNMKNRDGGGEAQVVARGVTPKSLTLRPKMKLIAGTVISIVFILGAIASAMITTYAAGGKRGRLSRVCVA